MTAQQNGVFKTSFMKQDILLGRLANVIYVLVIRIYYNISTCKTSEKHPVKISFFIRDVLKMQTLNH